MEAACIMLVRGKIFKERSASSLLCFRQTKKQGPFHTVHNRSKEEAS
jgi:hypothetical protein